MTEIHIIIPEWPKYICWAWVGLYAVGVPARLYMIYVQQKMRKQIEQKINPQPQAPTDG